MACNQFRLSDEPPLASGRRSRWACGTRVPPAAAALFVCSLVLPLAGCERAEQIERYAVPKETPPTAHRGGGATRPDRPGPATDRMLAAIVPLDDRAWFFKVSGPKDAVAAHAEPFLSLLKSLDFADPEKPTWKLPDGWKERAGSGMRLATFEIPSSGSPLELAVIGLPSDVATTTAYQLSNINRWREQMRLPPIGEDELAEQSVQFQVKGKTITLVNIVGSLSTGSTGGPPFAGRRSRPAAPGGRSGGAVRPPVAADAITFVAPKGWTPGEVKGFRKAAFTVADDQKEVEITVIDLAETGGDRLTNVNRWRLQIHLEPITPEELEKQIKKLPVGKRTGDYVELVGPSDAPRHESILAVIVNAGAKVWFFKMKGDAELVKREKERFEAFVGSAKIRGAEGAGDGD